MQVGSALALCEQLREQFRQVSDSTRAHHDACETLVAGQFRPSLCRWRLCFVCRSGASSD